MASTNMQKFVELVSKSSDEQAEFFLRSFIFELGEDWVQIPRLCTRFKQYLQKLGDGSTDLNVIQASDLLQKEGQTRTESERRAELEDIDLDRNNRLCLTEILLLLYKTMILNAYYKRVGGPTKKGLEDASNIATIGLGEQVLSELFTLPVGLDPILEQSISDFMLKKKEREDRLTNLQAISKLGGVKGLAAGNEFHQMQAQDLTWLNREELTLNAARKRCSKFSGDEALRAKREAEELEQKNKIIASRQRLKSKASMFEQNN